MVIVYDTRPEIIKLAPAYVNAPTLIYGNATERSDLFNLDVGKPVRDGHHIIFSNVNASLKNPSPPSSLENPFSDGLAFERVFADILKRS